MPINTEYRESCRLQKRMGRSWVEGMTQSEKQKNISDHLFQDGQKQPLSEVALTYSVTCTLFSSCYIPLTLKRTAGAFRGRERGN